LIDDADSKLCLITGQTADWEYLVQTALRFAPHWRLRALTHDQLDLLDLMPSPQFQKDRPATRDSLRRRQYGCARSRIPIWRALNVRTALFRARGDIPFFLFLDLFLTGAKAIH